MKNETKQQTAVEFLIEMTSKLGYVSADIAEQAKAMEEEQIIKAFNYGNADTDLAYGSEYFKKNYKK